MMSVCNICPRECGADRSARRGLCGESGEIRVAKIMLHEWEEPCVSRGKGSGAVFFSGCPLRCVYCQNKEISRGAAGKVFSKKALADEILSLQEQGAANINLVTPTHFSAEICGVLASVKEKLMIPVVWNTSGYEKTETLRMISPYVDVFLTDLKYRSREMSSKYSACADYFETALPALCEMVRITGAPKIENGAIKRGVILRHLVLPGGYKDSISILEEVESAVGHENVILSLMAQYTPEFLDEGFPELDRRITTFEYDKVVNRAIDLGYDGYIQSRSSATSKYTPRFK